MIRGEYKKVLGEVFDVLGFFDDEKEKVLEGFKRKFAQELLNKLQIVFSEDQRQWLTATLAKKEYDKTDPKVADLQKTIELAFENDEFSKVSRSVFKKILLSYCDFMASKVDVERAGKLKKMTENF